MTEARFPRNEEAERAVIGGVLVNPDSLPEVRALLQPNDFFEHDALHIFAAICKLDDTRTPIDMLAVCTALGPDLLEAIGGLVTVSQMMDGVPVLANVPFYAKLVRETARRRRAMVAADDFTATLGEGGDALVASDRLTDSLRLTFQQDANTCPTLPEVLEGYLDDLQLRARGQVDRSWMGTGIESLDELIGGYCPGDLVLIGARPSIGKTAFALTTARHRAETGGVLFFETEMTAQALSERLLASEARVDLKLLRTAKPGASPSEDEWKRLEDAYERLRLLDLVIEDTPVLNMSLIRARVIAEKARRLRDGKTPLRDVVIDYLQLLEGQGRDLRESVTRIAREAKVMAREEDVAVLLLSQLRRPDGKTMPPPPPHLHELRESGAIEEAADLVLLLDRPEFYLRAAGQDVGEHAAVGYISVAKQRQGPVGRFKVGFRPDSCVWADVWWLPQPSRSAGTASDTTDAASSGTTPSSAA